MARHREAAARAPDALLSAVTRPPLPNWQALLTPVVTNTFDELDIGVAFWLGGDFWQSIHVTKNVVSFEAEHGSEQRRWSYNHRIFAEVVKHCRIVRGEHAGFHDLFVPIQDRSGVRSVLVAGPIAIKRPSSAEVLERWYDISHTQGRLTDPSFSEYLSTTFSTLTLEGPLFGAFEKLLMHFAHLVEGRPASEELTREIERLRGALLEAQGSRKGLERNPQHGERARRSYVVDARRGRFADRPGARASAAACGGGAALESSQRAGPGRRPDSTRHIPARVRCACTATRRDGRGQGRRPRSPVSGRSRRVRSADPQQAHRSGDASCPQRQARRTAPSRGSELQRGCGRTRGTLPCGVVGCRKSAHARLAHGLRRAASGTLGQSPAQAALGAFGQRGRAPEFAFPSLRPIRRSGALALRISRRGRSRPFASRARTPGRASSRQRSSR